MTSYTWISFSGKRAISPSYDRAKLMFMNFPLVFFPYGGGIMTGSSRLAFCPYKPLNKLDEQHID